MSSAIVVDDDSAAGRSSGCVSPASSNFAHRSDATSPADDDVGPPFAENPFAPRRDAYASTPSSPHTPPTPRRGLVLTSNVTSSGIPIGDADVIVGRGGPHEIVLADATLRCATLPRSRLGFVDAAVEQDFVAFIFQSRMPLFIVAAFDMLQMVLLAAAGIPFSDFWCTYERSCADAIVVSLGFCMTDTAVRLVARCGWAHPVSRTGRARVHEVLMGVMLVQWAVSALFAEIVAVDAYFCPGDDFSKKLPPLPQPSDFTPAGTACITVSYGDTSSSVMLATFFMSRVKVQGVALLLLFVIACFIQTVNVFGPRYAGFYDVSTAELLRRCGDALVHFLVALLMTRVVEQRSRERFEAVAAGAYAVAQRTQTLKHMRALRRQLAFGGAHGGRDVDAGSSLGNTFSNSPTTLSGGSGALRVGCCTVALCRIGNAENLPLHDTEALADHFDALQELVVLANAPANVRVLVSGDGICVRGAATHAGALAAIEAEEGAEHEAHLAEMEATLEANAEAVCAVVHRLSAGVSSVSALHPQWGAARVHLTGIVSTGDVCWEDGVDSRIDNASTTVAHMRNLLDVGFAPHAKVVVLRSTMMLVERGFAATGYIETRDGERGCLLGGPLTLPRRVDAQPWPNSLEEATAALDADLLAEDDATLGRLDVQLQQTSWCSCCCRVARDSAVLRWLMPRFEDPSVEFKFRTQDNRSIVAVNAVNGVALIIVVTFLLALVLAEPRPGSSRWLAAAPLLVVLAVALAFVPLYTGHVTRMNSVARALIPTAYVAVGCTAVVLMRPTAFALAKSSVYTQLSSVAMIGALALPEVWPVRLALALGFGVAVNLTVARSVVVGHQRYADAAGVGVLMVVVACAVWSRRHRAQFVDTHYLDAMRADLNDTRHAVDAALRRLLPMVVTASLRDAPDGPLCRPTVVAGATVAVIQLSPMLSLHDVRKHLADVADCDSELGTSAELGDRLALSGSGRAGAPANADGETSTPTSEERPTVTTLTGLSSTASREGRESVASAAIAHFASSFADAYVTANGDSILLMDLPVATALQQQAGTDASADGRQDRSGLSTSAVALSVAMLCGPQAGIESALQPVYRVALFPENTSATVRVGIHRANLVVGLIGARTCSTAAFGPALNGAQQLASTSIALGNCVASTEADWHATPTHHVSGIGQVAVMRVADGSVLARRRMKRERRTERRRDVVEAGSVHAAPLASVPRAGSMSASNSARRDSTTS